MSEDASSVATDRQVDSTSELYFWLFVVKPYDDHPSTSLRVPLAGLFALPTIAPPATQVAVV